VGGSVARFIGVADTVAFRMRKCISASARYAFFSSAISSKYTDVIFGVLNRSHDDIGSERRKTITTMAITCRRHV